MSTPKERFSLAGSERAPLEGAREIGPANPNETVDATIRLRSRAGKKPIVDAAEFTKPIQKRTILSRKEFEQRHGADPDSIARVESFARQHKLMVKEKSPSRRTVILSGTVAAMNDAFGVDLREYEHPNGSYRGRTGPVHIPAELQDVIEGVFGLDNRPQAKPHFRRRQGRGGVRAAAVSLSYTPVQVAALYNFPTGVDGAGECIALIELGGGYNPTDLSNYWSQLKLSETPTVSAVSVGNGSNNPTGDPNSADGEVMLDIEVCGSIAPAAKIVVYFAENTDAGFLNAITTAVHDSTNNDVTSITDPMGHQTTFAYNGMGLVTAMTDAMADSAQFTYNLANLIGITDPLLNTTSQFVDAAGRVTQRTDPLGHTTKYQYNNLNQVTQITDPLQGITTITYDPDENLQTFQDARQQGTNNKTVYTYDNFDHLQTRTDPLSRQETYVFDQLANLTGFTDRRGKVATYQYDGINRRTFGGYGALPGPTYESTITYTYDGGNRLTKIVDSTSGTITPVFDGLNRLTSETTPQGSVSYQYDNDSRLQTATVSGQPTVNYYFDNGSRLYKVTQGSTSTLIGYDNANRRNSLTLPNGIVLTYGYDNDSRISSMSYQLGTTSVGSLTYQYDAAGRRTQVGGSLAAVGFPQAMNLAVYDVANELTSWNGTTITPDANGNILNDGVAAYTWNARNQLTSRAGTSFEYDPYGRRILNPTGNNLLYEGWNAAQELSGTSPLANRIVGGIDEFFNRTDSTGAYSPITDALGTVLALSNSSGNITTQYGYDPYGNTTSYGGTSTNVFQYAGRENDGNGLYFYRARYYSPTFGRFTSEDPMGFQGGINVYAYVGNNPISRTDPFGMKGTPWWDWSGWDHVPGVQYTKCWIWGVSCANTTRKRKLDQIAHPETSFTYTPDDLANPIDPGVRTMRQCTSNDDNCRRFLNECGDTALAPVADGMFPK